MHQGMPLRSGSAGPVKTWHPGKGAGCCGHAQRIGSMGSRLRQAVRWPRAREALNATGQNRPVGGTPASGRSVRKNQLK